MAGLMRELDLAIPPFVRLHRVVVAHTLRHRPGARGRVGLTLRVESDAGRSAPMPFLESAEASSRCI
eukprot:SM000151S01493  [mRNA]  locus=s151:178261:178461:+ [translate_table: standard]